MWGGGSFTSGFTFCHKFIKRCDIQSYYRSVSETRGKHAVGVIQRRCEDYTGMQRGQMRLIAYYQFLATICSFFGWLSLYSQRKAK